MIIGPREVGGAAAVIRAFWCGLAKRKGHPLNISGRTTGWDREGGVDGRTGLSPNVLAMIGRAIYAWSMHDISKHAHALSDKGLFHLTTMWFLFICFVNHFLLVMITLYASVARIWEHCENLTGHKAGSFRHVVNEPVDERYYQNHLTCRKKTSKLTYNVINNLLLHRKSVQNFSKFRMIKLNRVNIFSCLELHF